MNETGLLQAGLDLSAERGLAGLTVDAVIDRAGTGKGTFYRHFGDRSGFLRAVHSELRRRVWSAASEAMAERDPGSGRLRAGVTAYLDACLSNRALKTFVTEARVDPQVALAVEEDLTAGADVLAVDLAAIGWKDPAAAAQLLMAMAHEIALTEQRAARPERRLRRTVLAIAEHPPTAVDA